MSILDLKIALLGCSLISYNSEILITCPSKRKFTHILKRKNHIIGLLIQHNPELTQVTIAVDNSKYRVNLSIMSQKIIIPSLYGSSQSDLIREVLAYEGACGIIRMSDHRGLFSNSQIVLSSNAHPNDWIGKKMSDWWIPSELDTYLQRLSKERELRSYSYVAKMMDGQNAKLTVDARLIVWNGDLCRMVKTVNREILT